MDKFIQDLLQYNKDVAPLIEKIFDQEKNRVSKITPMAGKMVDEYKDFLLGGGKLRGYEIFLGYQMFGGKNKQVGLTASLTIEIVHSFLLMHDDFMDQDALRRGKPTIHKKYALKHGDHYGESMAINLGDVGCLFAYRILNSLKLPAERLVLATKFLSQVLIDVGVGQALDITYGEEKNLTEGAVLQIHRYKTAGYTVSGPLSIGAILAGADEKKLKALEDFGIPVGVAFQIRDDELGMFSSEKQIGKPVDSDLKEGKVTLLIVKALESASGEDKKFLKHAHGNQHLTSAEVERVRSIFRETGAFEYSHNLAKKLSQDGKKFIPQITSDPEFRKMLSGLADFVVDRQP